MTYQAEIKDAFLKLENYRIGSAKYAEDSYFTITSKEGEIVLTLDPFQERDAVSETGMMDIQKALKAAGIERATCTDQYRKYIYKEEDYDKNGELYSGVCSVGTDPEPHATNPNPDAVMGGDTNYRKLEVVVPDTLDSVLKLKAAHRELVTASAKSSIEECLQEVKSDLSQLGEKEGAEAYSNVLKACGLSERDSLAKG